MPAADANRFEKRPNTLLRDDRPLEKLFREGITPLQSAEAVEYERRVGQRLENLIQHGLGRGG
ncbi:MAG: hypothetical protein M3020_11360 [Myxococcota bacterium]|nr:hypothetical protein [Myxococcota bacterium]